jgi:DNA-binding MarR family transcriptional regulator
MVTHVTTPAEDISIPALLRAAREVYIQSIREHLGSEGYDDLPRNGPFVLGGMANRGAPAAEMTKGLGVTRQAASQLIDTLVVRGYLTRDVDQADRRRITITLTPRGQAAGQAVRAGVQAVDSELATRISGDQLAGLRAGLIALAQIKQDWRAARGDAR